MINNINIKIKDKEMRKRYVWKGRFNDLYRLRYFLRSISIYSVKQM